MQRREFIALLAGAVASRPIIALAQVLTKRPLIAVLLGASQATSEATRSAFTQRLQELGYVEGRDYEIEYRYADGDLTRIPALVNEVIRLKPSVIVVGNSTGALAAKRATASIPIVAAVTLDPVSLGLATSQARPEGNITGIVGSLDTLVGKQLELGFELVPRGKLAGMLVDVGSQGAGFLRRGAENAAQAMGARLLSAEVRAPADIDAAFQALTRAHVNIVIVPTDPMLLNERRRIAELAIAAQLPIVCGFREHVDDGGLMSYGIDLRENFRRAAVYVDKILKGAKAADLPIEQPTKFELVISLKTARAIGLTIPEAFLLRADEVIE
jgi:putative tryptophan/tyrosine transport system substrate-binding protein